MPIPAIDSPAGDWRTLRRKGHVRTLAWIAAAGVVIHALAGPLDHHTIDQRFFNLLGLGGGDTHVCGTAPAEDFNRAMHVEVRG